MNQSGLVEDIVSLHERKDWRTIIETYHSAVDRCKLLWVFPSEENLSFISRALSECSIRKIVSIGCGSGLLEWILHESLNVNVTGVEVDGAWWTCKYAPPTFLKLHFAKLTLDDDDRTKKILNDDSSALLFCYFNNRPAFTSYLEHYTGNTLIIIGPKDKCTHTDPLPFEPELDDSWTLYSYQEVRDSKDYIVVYSKSKPQSKTISQYIRDGHN